MRPSRAALGTAIAAVPLAWLVHANLIDDVFITLAYARNVATDLHWGVIPTETANSATSPLNVGVLALAHLVLRNGPLAVSAVFVGSAAAFAWYVARTTRALGLSAPTTVVAVALVLLNPFLLSSVGMEATTVGLVLVGALAFYALEGRPRAFGVASGLAVLTRPDMLVLAVVLLALHRELRRHVVTVAGLAVAVALPWLVFSWLQLGSAFPVTLLIKTAQSWEHGFGDGPLFYADRVPAAVVISFIPAVLGAVATVAWWLGPGRRGGPEAARMRPVAALGLAGIAHYAAYSVLGVPPYVWYYVPSIVATSVALVVLAPSLLTAWRRPVAQWAGAALLAMVAAEAVVVLAHDPPTWREPVIIGNVAPSSEYRAIGRELREAIGDGTVTAPTEIGALAYACECSIVDVFSDPGQVEPYVESAIGRARPGVRQVLQLNGLHRDRDEDPRVPDHQLVLVGGPIGRDTPEPAWELHSDVAGTTHLELRPTPVRPAVVERLVEGIVEGIPPDVGRVSLRWSGVAPGEEEPLGESYETALVPRLRAAGVDVRRNANRRDSDLVVMVAADEAVDEVRRERGTRLLAYGGDVSWAEREELKRQEARIKEGNEAGEIDDLTAFLDVSEIREQLGADVAVFTMPD